MSRRNLMARRDVLKSALGGLLLAPLLRQRNVLAAGTGPKRLILAFTPDSHPPEWWPTGSGKDFTLQPTMKDFEDLKRHLLFVRRLDHSWTFDNHHLSGPAQLFTGGQFNNDTERYADGPSIEHYLLQNGDLRGGTPRTQLALGLDDGRTDVRHIISYSGSGQPVFAELDPTRAFENVFGGLTFDGKGNAGASADWASKHGVSRELTSKIVEVNVRELKYLQRFLGKDESERLDSHVESLQVLKKSIQATKGETQLPTGGSCLQPDITGYSKSLNDAASITRWADINIDLIVNALSCDVTRSASFQLSFSGGHHEGLLGFPTSWHNDIVHSSNESPVIVGSTSMTTREAFNVFSRFWAGHVARLARRLASTPEGDGSMLDNTLIYWGVESGTNHSHSPVDMQYLLIGGKNLGFQLGQSLDVGLQSAHRLHVSVLNAFGVNVESFGSADPGTGALPGVLA